ncbi:MAG: SelB C-terminal domain-containing protein, partial [Actinobacteria bacterium]|nr:SelB C-terminal domain-containing protein [Actinomycetota bacterium]
GIEHGVVALTKVDAADAETLELAREEARELVPGAPGVATSARTGEGLGALRHALGEAAARVGTREAAGATRLFVDRSFSLRGIGTVVTGTLWSGSVGGGDELVVEPGGRRVRIRSVQVHDRPVERAAAGQRVAVALPGVERSDIRRGQVLVPPNAYPVSYRLDISLAELEPIRDGARLHVHHGTGEHYARVVRSSGRHAQLRLTTPAVAARGDRVVLRDGSTVGGGTVVDPAPPRHADPTRFELVERGDVATLVHEPVPLASLQRLLDADTDLEGVVRAGEWVMSGAWLDDLRADVDARLGEADELEPGIPIPAAPWAREVLPLLDVELRGSRLYAPGSSRRKGVRPAAADDVEREVTEAGFTPVKVEDAMLARYLEEEGTLVRLSEGWVVSRRAYDEARRVAVEECERSGSITLARFRDLLGTGRRPAQLLLERFDSDGVTRRVGDERVLRRRART